MTLINFEGKKVNVGETVRLKASTSGATNTMTVVTADYENDRLVLADAGGSMVSIAPDCWCLVYPE